jgi:hypothetical protein
MSLERQAASFGLALKEVADGSVTPSLNDENDAELKRLPYQSAMMQGRYSFFVRSWPGSCRIGKPLSSTGLPAQVI